MSTTNKTEVTTLNRYNSISNNWYAFNKELKSVSGVSYPAGYFEIKGYNNKDTLHVEKDNKAEDKKQTMNFEISKIDIFNNKVVKVKFSDGTIERAICDEEDEFDLKIGVFICISKYLYKDTLTNHGIYIKALELSWYKEYNKIVDKAIKDYYKNLDKEIKEKEEKQLEKEKAARRKIKNNIRKAKQKKKKIENEVETIPNYLEKRNKSEVVKENEK